MPSAPIWTKGEPGPNKYAGHTITTIAESPLKAKILLWVGTDDGNHPGQQKTAAAIEIDVVELAKILARKCRWSCWITRIRNVRRSLRAPLS